MKKFVIIFLFLLSSCGFKQYSQVKNIQNPVNLPSISTGITEKGILVGVGDPHAYSKIGPKIYSGSYYFNPSSFYIYPLNISVFKLAYSPDFDDKPVYYYDENNGAQAGMVVYVLRDIYHKKNVSLVLNSNLKKNLTYGKYRKIENLVNPSKIFFTGGFVGTGKYLVAYNPKLINFNTGDLLLYSSDFGTMKQDYFYKNLTGVNINAFDWSKLVDFDGNLKSKQEISKLLKPLQLDKYNNIYIYYPRFWYRSGFLTLYLQKEFK